MKKIGFIDCYLSNWHANNYPAWIRESCQERGLEYELAYAWAEVEVSPRDGKTTDEWCKENNAVRCNSIEEICEKSDVLFILAPTNPEKHLEYAKTALKYGKRTYIDKTFAPNYAEAAEIFALADQYGTECFSTSALRYGTELDTFENPQKIITTGAGRTPEEYIVHQVEMIVKLLGCNVKALKAQKESDTRVVYDIAFADNKSATAIWDQSLGFTATAINEKGEEDKKAITSPFFKILLDKIIVFFETGEVDFDRAETLTGMKLRERMLVNEGEWEEIAPVV